MSCVLQLSALWSTDGSTAVGHVNNARRNRYHARQVIDSVGYTRAFFELFEGAIYMHQVTTPARVFVCV